jgi:putative transposase
MGGLVYHVLNRAAGRVTIFEKDADHEAFERVIEQTHLRFRTRMLSCCVMPNHWAGAPSIAQRWVGAR